MTARRLVDSHHHLWRMSELPATGILASPSLARDFGWEDLEAAAPGVDLEASVFVQVHDDDRDVSLVERVIADHPRLQAMIAWAPVERPGVESRLRDLAALRFVRGVRRSTQLEADPSFVSRPAFVSGARTVGAKGLLLELCVRYQQLPAVPALARACPETAIVIEHLGKPDVSAAPPTYWLDAMSQLGELGNVHCKVSVVVHEDDDPPPDAGTLGPFVRHAVDCFGWERVLFGSNWPVATCLIGYLDWIELVEACLPAATPAQLQRLFSENAKRVYRLGGD